MLLTEADSADATAYYQQLLGAPQYDGVEVRLDAGDGKGKGIFARKSFKRGDLVFKERPLVSCQHVENRGQSIACDQCHRHVGTVEQQIGHKLLTLVSQLSQQTEEQEDDEEAVDMEAVLAMGERLQQIYENAPTEQVQALVSGELKLPLSDQVQLPPAVPCRSGCGAVFCSSECEAAAWKKHHCLMCTGAPSAAAAAAEAAAGSSAGAGAGTGASASTSQQAAAGPSGSGSGGRVEVEVVPGISVDRDALRRFEAHAAETNDVFILAARLVAGVLLSAAAALQAEESGSGSGASSADPSSSGSGLDAAAERALASAWRPYRMGWKRVWWESVAVPDDVEDEQQFRDQLKDLATESLELLTAAIHAPRFATALLDLRVYGSIIGMFELNNLALAVPSPVEDYFLAIDALPPGPQKQAVQAVSAPLLDALDSDYCTPCETSAFLALQSCANHSCEPAAEAMGEASGEAAILALRDIAVGEEVTLSYIDEGAGYKERQAALADYGFKCGCGRCVREKAARAAKAAQKQKAKLSAAMKKR